VARRKLGKKILQVSKKWEKAHCGASTEKFIKGHLLRYSEENPMASEYMKQDRAEEIIDGFKTGHIFSVQFVKKNGDIREMVCRKSVRKGVKGTGAGWGEGALKPLRTVFDMSRNGFRTIPTDRIISMKVGGVVYHA
tara:strand:+ start:533 stop:943 length:411 start_codon:yes stop_codon:yes gene_type:complete